MKKLLYFLGLLVSNVAFSQQYDEAAAQTFQNEMNAHYSDSVKSPLPKADLKDFHGLDFYAPNAKYFVVAKFKRTKNEKPFAMKTSTARLPMYVKYGEVTFSLDGKECKLNLYQNADRRKKKEFEADLFLPFSDATSGNETYIGGRYLDLKVPEGETLAIDFNQAYNPYCAYNHIYSCPIVPLENDVSVEIKAGVKKYHD